MDENQASIFDHFEILFVVNEKNCSMHVKPDILFGFVDCVFAIQVFVYLVNEK